MQRFRNTAKAAGYPDIHLNAVAWGLNGMTRICAKFFHL